MALRGSFFLSPTITTFNSLQQLFLIAKAILPAPDRWLWVADFLPYTMKSLADNDDKNSLPQLFLRVLLPASDRWLWVADFLPHTKYLADNDDI